MDLCRGVSGCTPPRSTTDDRDSLPMPVRRQRCHDPGPVLRRRRASRRRPETGRPGWSHNVARSLFFFGIQVFLYATGCSPEHSSSAWWRCGSRCRLASVRSAFPPSLYGKGRWSAVDEELGAVFTNPPRSWQAPAARAAVCTTMKQSKYVITSVVIARGAMAVVATAQRRRFNNLHDKSSLLPYRTILERIVPPHRRAA